MLQKQPVNISFAQGLDQKTDPYQLPIGKFSRLQNMVFNKAMRLTKRNGFGLLTSLTGSNSFLTTFNNNLTAVGNSIQGFIEGPNIWVNKGAFYPVDLEVLPLIRNNSSQTQVDSVVSNNDLVCTVYTEVTGGTTVYKYVVASLVTGQNVLPPAAIPSNGTVTNAPRVFFLGSYFIIVFGSVITATNHLQYVRISTINPAAPTGSTDLSTSFTPSTTLAYDGFVANNNLYLAWNGADGGGAVRMSRLDSTLTQANTVTFASRVATMMSVYADTTGATPTVWATFWDSGSTDGYTLAVNQNLSTLRAPVKVISSTTILNITSVAQNGIVTFFFELPNNYTYDSSIPTHLIKSNTCNLAGTVGSAVTVDRSVGIASKAFLYSGTPYLLSVYVSPTQPTYFLINLTGKVVSKLAYSNAGGYITHGLPSTVMLNGVVSFAYQFKDLIVPVNKTQGASNSSGVYSQLGINLVTYTFATKSVASEIGSILNLTGGMPWMYDGYSPVELGFNLWPDSVEVTTSTSGGSVTDQVYFYQALYEWSDNQGNIHRSAPSIPVTVTAAGGNTSTNTITVPTLRLTYKTGNPVKIVLYRWSTGQQIYYQVTSVTSPTVNDTTVDYVTITDTLADSSIAGNSIIYTTGGVVENIAGPACSSSTLFDSRLWVIDSEDRNLLWYSKPVIEGTTVEMSDLFTYYVAPSISAQGSTGITRCLFPMDDKLILFKSDAMYFVNGVGPDITGSNSQYSQPIFITSTVGSVNQQSIVLMQDGLMFQSDKGIWLLGRNLVTKYIGAEVEDYTTGATVLSALNVPETTQVRFTLDSGITLMYDYFYKQWGTFNRIPSISSTLYNNLHTYLDSDGFVFQETPNVYLDGSNPVLQAFTTGWINPAGLMGYQRAYWFNLLGTYYSPHKLNIQIGYNYQTPSQTVVVTPNITPSTWGSEALWGSGTWGGSTNIEQARIDFDKQQCESFQIQVDEVYDSSYGIAAGQGLSLSGINLTIAAKKSFPPLSPAQRFG